MSGILNFNKNSAPDNSANNSNSGSKPSGVPFQIDILELNPSRMNPRRAHAGEYRNDYESLKQSIKNIGLQSTLTVTKQDGAEHYELYNGGNTRLKVLTELYHESLAEGLEEKANNYRYQQVVFVPYTDDLDVLVKHMAENEERINMTFIDKARAIFQIRQLYLAKNDVEKISNRKLVEYIHDLGWTSVNDRAMTELSFAFEKLERSIPLALNSGMGRPKIQQLRLWLSYAVKYIDWLIKNNDYDYSAEKTEALYLAVLSEFDDDIDPINLNDFYQDFIFKWSNQLMQFDKKLRAEKVEFELRNIEEVGEVMEERDPAELSRELRETATVPPFEYPEPRKPRQPKSVTGAENLDTGAGNTQKTITGSQDNNHGTMLGTQHLEVAPADNNTLMYAPVNTQQPHELLLADCKAQVKTFLDYFVENWRMSTCPSDFLSYGGDDEWQDNTPFFSLDLSNDALRQQAIRIILSATWAEQYALLHLLYLYIVFNEYCFLPDDYTEAQKQTVKTAKKLWAEFAPKYNSHKALCEFDFVRQHPTQREDMLKVHQMTLQHIACIYVAEQGNYEESSAGGE